MKAIEKIYPSEAKAPSPPVRYQWQTAPTDELYPFPITEPEALPTTGDEQARDADGDNPPVLAPRVVGYCNPGPSARDETEDGVPLNRAKATNGGDFLASQGLG